MLILLVAYGICFGIMNDKAKFLTDILRSIPLFKNEKGTLFSRMFACSYCTGFHSGWIAYLLTVPMMKEIEWFPNVTLEAICYAFASAIFCYGVDVILQWFER